VIDPPLHALPVAEYLDRLAGGNPTPGGGSAAAVAGALGAALISMVCNLTAGREKYKEHEAEVVAVRAEAEAVRARLTKAIQDDALVYLAVMDTYKMPRDTEEQRAARDAARGPALREAARVPMEIAEACVEVIRLGDRAAGKTNPNAASDIAVALFLAGGALESAVANVQINIPLIADQGYVADLRDRIDAARAARDALLDRVVERTRA
jgi:methenyltetrahydrofolate cyclohydrolase